MMAVGDHHRMRSIPKPPDASIIYVVDDDISVRESLEHLIRHAGYEVVTFVSAQDFLLHPHSATPSCLILDIYLPGLDGLGLQQKITAERPDMPIIFITAHADVPTSVRAMKGGATEFLTKPFSNEDLLHAIGDAVERSRIVLAKQIEFRQLKERYLRLTPREREVLKLVVSGLANKNVASEMGITEITVKGHRGSVMKKMEASSLADLIYMCTKLRLTRNSAPVSQSSLIKQS